MEVERIENKMAERFSRRGLYANWQSKVKIKETFPLEKKLNNRNGWNLASIFTRNPGPVEEKAHGTVTDGTF